MLTFLGRKLSPPRLRFLSKTAGLPPGKAGKRSAKGTAYWSSFSQASSLNHLL
jgi:hypothetical protein